MCETATREAQSDCRACGSRDGCSTNTRDRARFDVAAWQPSRKLWGMVCVRLATRFGVDWPYEMRDNEDSLSSRSALCSLARTCHYSHAMVEPCLYGTVHLTSGR